MDQLFEACPFLYIYQMARGYWAINNPFLSLELTQNSYFLCTNNNCYAYSFRSWKSVFCVICGLNMMFDVPFCHGSAVIWLKDFDARNFGLWLHLPIKALICIYPWDKLACDLSHLVFLCKFCVRIVFIFICVGLQVFCSNTLFLYNYYNSFNFSRDVMKAFWINKALCKVSLEKHFLFCRWKLNWLPWTPIFSFFHGT